MFFERDSFFFVDSLRFWWEGCLGFWVSERSAEVFAEVVVQKGVEERVEVGVGVVEVGDGIGDVNDQ